MQPCPYCGICTVPAHTAESCPQVAEVEYFASGQIKRVVKRPLVAYSGAMPYRPHFDTVPPTTFAPAQLPYPYFTTCCSSGAEN